MSAAQAFSRFKSARYYPALDGLRAVSILLVLTWHTADPLWGPLKGYVGVTTFFVISGFLITTLLLREGDRDDGVSLRGFYTRRAFRILPLYVLALLATTAGVLAGLGEGSAHYGRRMLHFVTFTNEFAGAGAFSQGWSLGIEEKFYLLWPLLGFAIVVLARWRAAVALGLLLLSVASLVFTPRAYPAIYTPILAGCVLAIAMDHRSSFPIVMRLTNPWVLLALPFAVIGALMVERSVTGYVHVPVRVGLGSRVPRAADRADLAESRSGLETAGLRRHALLRRVPLPSVRHKHRRSWSAASRSAPGEVLRLVLVIALSLGAAEVLYRAIEGPMIRRGRELSRLEHSEPALGMVPEAA